MLILVKSIGWLLAFLPKQFAQVLSVILGDIRYYLPTSRRQVLLSNLHHAFPDKPAAWHRRKARTSCRRLLERRLFSLAEPFFSEVRLDQTLIATDEAIELLEKYANPSSPLILATICNSQLEACTLLRRAMPFETAEVGAFYHPLSQKSLNNYLLANRSRHGCTFFDDTKELSLAYRFLKKGNWMAVVFDQNLGKSRHETFLLNRIASTTRLHESMAKFREADVLAMWGERTGFWEGNLNVEKISSGKKNGAIVLKANRWLEEKLATNLEFCRDWMWIQDRWKAQTKVSENLNLNFSKSLIRDCQAYYNWENLPRQNRVWFRMPTHLGEFVKWIPFIKAVRESRGDAEITLLVNRRFKPLAEALRVADQVLPLPRRNLQYYRKVWQLRWNYPDTIYNITQSRSADLETKLINAPRRYGMRWPGTTRSLLTDVFKIDPGWDESKNHQVDLWSEYFKHFGLEGEIDFTPLRIATQSEVINPLRCLQTESQYAPYFGLICGAGNCPEKCWPADYWVELVASLMDLYPDSNICLFGTSADLPVSREIIEQFEPGSIHDFTGSTTLMQFVMALKSCSVVISNDCGGLHLANALGVPTVGLYGLTNPIYSGPVYESPYKIVLPAGCPKRGGVSPDHICLSQVLEAVSELVPQNQESEKEPALVY